MPSKILVGDASIDLLAAFDSSDEDSIAAVAEVIDARDETDDPLVEFDLEDDIPSKIPDIIKLMDKLDPDQNYFNRRANLPKKMRVKLRAFARKEENENHPAVKHWVSTKDWRPPNETTLRALMVLMREMINKAWPLE